MVQSNEKDGIIFRKGNEVIVQYGGKEKIFKRKPIFFGEGALEQAVANYLTVKRGVVLAMNGYTSLSPEKCRAYGIQPGGYETACAATLADIIKESQKFFRGIRFCLAHGAIYKGVDKAVINVGHKFNIPQLGFNCPEYMIDVEDDDVPVYVAPSKEAYCDAFTESLDILITANGRKTTFEMDIDAVFKKHKDVIRINMIRAISTMGGPPALNEKGEIEDAVAFWDLKMHNVSSFMEISGIDSWETMKKSLIVTSTKIVRRMMPPTVAFGYEWHQETD